MSFFEWMAEPFNPGSTGSVRVGGGVSERSNAFVLAHAAVSTGLLVGGYSLISATVPGEHQTMVLLGFIVYMVVAFFLRPEPDKSNMVWLGGLIDDPFRISDDINRGLFFVGILLWPGRFVAQGFVDLAALLFRLTAKL